MKIVHVALRYPPALGGAESYVRDIAEHTRNIPENRDVRVITSKLRTHHPAEELSPELLSNDAPYIQRLHHLNTPHLAYPRLRFLKHYLGHHKPDILHAYSFWYQPADVAARYATNHSTPFIFHPIYYTNDVRQKLIWKLYASTVGKKTFAAADIVAVISPYEQSLIEKAGFPVKRFELIPPGIDVSRFERRRLNPFLKRGIKGQVLLTVSRLADGKGINELVTAFTSIIKQHPDTHLCIVGEDFGAKHSLETQVETLGFSSHVHFLGRLTDEELVAAYQHATVFVHPSHYEAFGIVLAEALAAGTPVVARNSTAIPFVAPHDIGGLLFSTPDELIQNTSSLLTDVKLRERLALHGRQYVGDNFSWSHIIKKLVSLYQELHQW